MNERPLNVLFLCTGNSARSILAEQILNHKGAGRYRAFSAGSHPAGRVNAFAIDKLQRERIPAEGLRSKSWDEFALPGAVPFDFIFTVCDNAANEVCPVWPGRPLTAHWGVPDPAAVQGTDDDKRKAFDAAFVALDRRIDRFLGLPIRSLDAPALSRMLDEIGRA